MAYKLFYFDSRNTGYYKHESNNLRQIQAIAKQYHKARIDGPDGFMEGYEDGELVAWSPR